MTPQSSRTMVLLVGGLMFAAIGLRRSQIGDPFKFAWAAGVITLGLSVLSDVAPEIAGPFAILVLMAVYWRNRRELSGLVPSSSSSTPTAASPTSTAQGGIQR